MKTRTSTALSLCIVLASAIVRCKAVALDASTRHPLRSMWGGGLLDCSWDEADVGRWLDSANSSYWQRNWVCSDAKLPTRLKKTRPTIVCIGDSNTRGIGVPTAWKSNFPAQLHSHSLLRNVYNVVNLGIAGSRAQRSNTSTTSYWNTPHWNKVLPALSNVAFVIVQLGTSDARVGLWNRTAFRHDYVMMLQKINEMHPKAVIITSVPPPVSKYASERRGFAYVNNELGPEIVMATDIMTKLSMPLKHVNMQTAFAAHDAAALKDAAIVGEQPKRRLDRLLRKMLPPWQPETLLQDDGLHATLPGHALMADTFADAIEPMP
jgi:lysophospholipase L1-like esterase